MSEVTRLLVAIEEGDSQATAALFPLVYDELRRLARIQMSHERAEHTLDATALVHEAYLRLIDDSTVHWENCGHFCAAVAEAMRRILIEYARRKQAQKRGGSLQRVDLHNDLPEIRVACRGIEDLLSLSDALDLLAAEDADLAQLVKLLVFAGFSFEDAATALGISRATAYRRWTFARAWLHRTMNGQEQMPLEAASTSDLPE